MRSPRDFIIRLCSSEKGQKQLGEVSLVLLTAVAIGACMTVHRPLTPASSLGEPSCILKRLDDTEYLGLSEPQMKICERQCLLIQKKTRASVPEAEYLPL